MSAPEISRKQAWCKLAVLIADGLPDPHEIGFIDPYDPTSEYASTLLDVIVRDASSLWRWAERLGAALEDPRWGEQSKKWRQSAPGMWHGYSLTVKTYNASELGAVDDGMATVRAIAAGTSRAGDPVTAPEVPAIATAQPGDSVTPAGGEVAGPDGRSGPATERAMIDEFHLQELPAAMWPPRRTAEPVDELEG